MAEWKQNQCYQGLVPAPAAPTEASAIPAPSCLLPLSKHIPSISLRHRRAAVGMILRQRPEAGPANNLDDLELLLIRRAHNPSDRWSGQMAFPGGRQRKDSEETDLQTVVREAQEEVGLNLNEGF